MIAINILNKIQKGCSSIRSTRAVIAYGEIEDLVESAIYVHFDGYPEYTGKTLLTYYNGPSLIDLFELGDIRFLEANVNDCKPYHSYDYDDVVDEFEDDPEAFCRKCCYWVDYVYFYDMMKECWYIFKNNRFKPLDSVVH